MKTKFLVLLGILALNPAFAPWAQAADPSQHRDLTVWIDAKIGSHIGGGSASTYLTNIRARKTRQDDPKFRTAIDSLDELGMLRVKGFGLVPAAVAWQTEVPIHTLVREQCATNLSYGELLIAHCLAAKSGESFTNVVAMRNRTRTWGDLARQLQVDPDFVITRANLAATRIRLVDFQTRRMAPREGGTNYTTLNPHTQTARLH